MNKCEVSIIVPIYNVEQYLVKCIESLLNQNFNKPYEIILVDDGSTDRSGDIADKYDRENELIKTVHKENGGLSSARNYGMQFAIGLFVTFVDSDDYVSESYLKDMFKVKDKLDADIVLTKICLMTEAESIKNHKEVIKTELVDGKEAFWEVYFQKKVSWSACAKLMKKEILDKHPFPLGYYEDSASMYLFLSETDKIALTDLRNNYHYIRRDGSITASKLSTKHMRIFEVCDEIRKHIDTCYPEWNGFVALIYQNAVLQLITRIDMSKEEYKSIFDKAVIVSRNNLLKILKEKRIGWNTKYYAVVLCTNPAVFRLQRTFMLKLNLIKGNWV